MVSMENRRWIWSLEKDQLIEKLGLLGLDCSGEVLALKLRLFEAGRSASGEHINLFRKWKEEVKREEEEILLQKWVYHISSQECKDVMKEKSLVVPSS